MHAPCIIVTHRSSPVVRHDAPHASFPRASHNTPPPPRSQGLSFDGGFLYESTGLYGGKSTVRKVEVETGNVVQIVKLGDKVFGEGMVIFQDKVGG